MNTSFPLAVGAHVSEQILINHGYSATVRLSPANALSTDGLQSILGGTSVLWQNLQNDTVLATSSNNDQKMRLVTILYIRTFDECLQKYAKSASQMHPFIFTKCDDYPNGEKALLFNTRMSLNDSKIVSKLLNRKLKVLHGISDYRYEYSLCEKYRFMVFPDESTFAYFLFSFSSFIGCAKDQLKKDVKTRG